MSQDRDADRDADMGRPRIFVLDAGLFPDGETVEAALSALHGPCEIDRVELRPALADRDKWDCVVRHILAADKIVVL